MFRFSRPTGWPVSLRLTAKLLRKMTHYPLGIAAKVLKFNLKLIFFAVCLLIFTLSLCYDNFRVINAKLFTSSVLDLSWRSFRVTEAENASRNAHSDYLRLQYSLPGHTDGSRSKCFPSCIIFGVSKCGTKALLEYLTLHPDVVAPSAEINFFCNKSLYSQGIDWYIDQMPISRPNQITVEKSPDYFQCNDCADLVYAARNRTKLLLLLRDPVERLVSQYMQLSEKNPSLPEIEKWVVAPGTTYINAKLPSVMVGAYSEHLSYWLEVFPRDQIHIIESDSLRLNPLEEMKRVERFLKLKQFYAPEDFYFNSSRGFYCTRRRSTAKTKCLGKSKGREHISVDVLVLNKLQRFYQPFNDKLSKLLGFRYPWS